MELDLEIIKTLIELMRAAELSELSIEDGDFKVSIKRAIHPPESATTAAMVPEIDSTASELIKPKEPVAPAHQPLLEEPSKEYTTIKSPRVGKVKLLEDLKVGSQVQSQQVICAIETMNLVSELKADAEGVISDILVEDGQPVEYGEELIRIKITKEVNKTDEAKEG